MIVKMEFSLGSGDILDHTTGVTGDVEMPRPLKLLPLWSCVLENYHEPLECIAISGPWVVGEKQISDAVCVGAEKLVVEEEAAKGGWRHD